MSSDPIEEQVSRLEDRHEPGWRIKQLQAWLDVELVPYRDDDGIVRVPGDRWCDVLLTLLEEVARIESDAYELGCREQHRRTADQMLAASLKAMRGIHGPDTRAMIAIADAPPPGMEEGQDG